MTADIIPFGRALSQTGRALPTSSGLPPTPLTHAWQNQHLPLIDAAMDLLQADDAEFMRRCRQIEETEGRSVLETLSAQLDRLSSHVGDVVEALKMTAMRIRTTIASEEGYPA